MNYVLRAITYLWISNEIDNNIFKARVYGNLLRLLSKINKLGLKEINEISKHKNIGKKSIEKLMEYYKTGKITVFENLTKNQISKIRKYLHAYKLLGFGKKEALEYSRNKNKILKPRTMLQKIGLKMKLEYSIPYKKALLISKEFSRKYLKNIEHIYVGSIRRKSSFVNDFDILICKNLDELIFDENIIVISRGKKKINLIYKKVYLFDLLFWDKSAAMLLHSTGSKYFNIYLRKKAISKSMKLNQYGLFKNEKKIKTLTERSIFNILEEKYILPSRR